MSTDTRPVDRTPTQTDPAPPPGPEPKPRLDLSVAKVGGGALAAMTAAVIGSHLSVAGTVVGAALASVVAAVAGAVYTTSIARTRERVKNAIGGRGQGRVASGREPSPSPRRPSRIAYRQVVVGALLVFGVAALALTGWELATGSALSGGQGTTISQVGDGGTGPKTKPALAATATPTRQPSPNITASNAPSARATATTKPAAPSTASTPVPSTTASTEPTPVPSSAPSTHEPSATAPAAPPSATDEPTLGAPAAEATPTG